MSTDLTDKRIAALARLAKRFRDIDARAREVDHERSIWARDARAVFSSDDEFVDWCGDELGVNPGRAREYIDRSLIASIVTDERQWRALGGFQKMRPLLSIPQKEWAGVISECMVGSLQVGSVLRRKYPRTSSNSIPAGKYKAQHDAEELAAFIREWFVDPPQNIAALVSLYAPGERGKRAA